MGIQLFPNPAKEYFFINTFLDNSIVELYSVNGDLIYWQQFQKTHKINSNLLEPGVYFVKVTVSGKTLIQKVLITP